MPLSILFFFIINLFLIHSQILCVSSHIFHSMLGLWPVSSGQLPTDILYKRSICSCSHMHWHGHKIRIVYYYYLFRDKDYHRKNNSQEKFRVAWYWNLRNDLQCISKYLQEHYKTVCHVSCALCYKYTRYFFQRDTSSESYCNRNFRGRSSGWNWLIVVMRTSTRVLPYKNTK